MLVRSKQNYGALGVRVPCEMRRSVGEFTIYLNTMKDGRWFIEIFRDHRGPRCAIFDDKDAAMEFYNNDAIVLLPWE